MPPCPCHSGKSYKECCLPFHKGELPSTPLQLMRSRYAAYARCLPSYIIDTTHKDNPSYNLNRLKWVKEIHKFCKSCQFLGLDILEETESSVTFFARLVEHGRDISFKEKSLFEKVDGKWFYLKNF